jgi:protocatechuate 3,4-dioxygenase beta subunit
MSPRSQAVVVVVLLVAVALLAVWSWSQSAPESPLPPSSAHASDAGAVPAAGALAAQPANAGEAGVAVAARESVAVSGPPTGVRGIVLDATNGRPLAGIDVIAVADQPALAPLLDRFRGLFQGGMFVETRATRRELGRTQSAADGTFELLGMTAGRVFLDGHSDGYYVRTPGDARLAAGQIVDGIELRASPGGRIRGIVLGSDGGPVAGSAVSVRPGLNAALGQLTDRQYRWLDTVTDARGRFDVPGVPAGQGYTVSASAATIALEEVHGVDVRVGQTTEVAVRGHQGALVQGRVLGLAGEPLAGANVAMVYLDISRVLFSADGKKEPVTTDADGRFRLEHVAAGRVAFIAAAADLAPSNIEELAVVDGGIYDDLVLQLGSGVTIAGRVVDDQQAPVAGAAVELRPFERPNDPQFLKMMLKVRAVAATTDADGRFVAKGLTGERLIVQAQKAGYTTALRWGVALDEPNLVIEVQRSAIVRGRVRLGTEPLARFRVDTRSTAIPKPGEKVAEAAEQDGPRGPFGRGGGGGDGPPWAGGGRRTGTRQLSEGTDMMARGFADMNGNWREIQAADGTFELRGIPPGRVRVRVRADGQLDPEPREVDLLPGQTSEVLEFELAGGLAVAGRVVDDSGRPVSDAQVTAYKQREPGERGRAGFLQIDPEDFDFLAMSAGNNRRSSLSDSKGQFTVPGLAAGRYRFTARHPDLAKSSTKDVEVRADAPPPEIEIVLDAGGAVEGVVTGLGLRPLRDAVIVAFSLQAGSLRSSNTDQAGYYRIDGLPPGQYVMFKSKLDARADNIPLEVLSNLRLKTVTVRQGKTARLDLQDDSDDGVRIRGLVREAGSPVPRALVTLLGTDRDGLLGMGIRANAADMTGRYELVGIKPGSYVLQVTRFQGQPVQTTFELEVPDDNREMEFDINLPTSAIAGRVVDSRGNPVKGVMVTLGSTEGALADAEGLVGLIAQNGLAQARTDDQGAFRLRSVAAGSYRLVANGAGGPRRRGGGETRQWGEGRIDGIEVDGVTDRADVVVTVPMAGRITGVVTDASGVPVADAEVACASTGKAQRRSRGDALLDLIGGGAPAVRTGSDGRFEIAGLTPGTYSLKVESEALEAGKLDDIEIAEEGQQDVQLRIVRGAVLRVRATNVDKNRIPLAQLSLFDSKGKPVVNRVSTFTVMRRLMKNRDQVEDSGWYEFGSVPPDTYTAVIAEPGKPEIRIVRTIVDGETVEWDVDVAAELAARDRK